jgi:hypothetical protein
MTPQQHRIPEPQPQLDAYELYASLWMLGLEVGRDPRLTLPAWLSECTDTILVRHRRFAKA